MLSLSRPSKSLSCVFFHELVHGHNTTQHNTAHHNTTQHTTTHHNTTQHTTTHLPAQPGQPGQPGTTRAHHKPVHTCPGGPQSAAPRPSCVSARWAPASCEGCWWQAVEEQCRMGECPAGSRCLPPLGGCVVCPATCSIVHGSRQPLLRQHGGHVQSSARTHLGAATVSTTRV